MMGVLRRWMGWNWKIGLNEKLKGNRPLFPKGSAPFSSPFFPLRKQRGLDTNLQLRTRKEEGF
jgi:hypothetical protein